MYVPKNILFVVLGFNHGSKKKKVQQKKKTVSEVKE